MKELSAHIEKLQHVHKLEPFDCKNIALNDYLKKYALTNQKLGVAQTYVGISGDAVIGFYSITVASVKHDKAPKSVVRGLPRYEIPVVLLGRLAVDSSVQRKGLGAGLLKDAILRTQKVADIVGIRALIVHAKDEEVVRWYTKFDFEPSPLDSRHLFLSLKDIRG
jgi:GNAT superfamily N-acetyltransferase